VLGSYWPWEMPYLIPHGPTWAAAPSPSFSPFLSFLLPHSRMLHLSPFLSFLPFLLTSTFFTPTHSDHEREQNVRERERAAVWKKRREKKTWVLESSVQSASTAPIDDHPWSDEAEILQGGSQHVNLHCERWRSDLEQSAVVFLHVNSSSILE
jgi:hypothetical protein